MRLDWSQMINLTIEINLLITQITIITSIPLIIWIWVLCHDDPHTTSNPNLCAAELASTTNKLGMYIVQLARNHPNPSNNLYLCASQLAHDSVVASCAHAWKLFSYTRYLIWLLVSRTFRALFTTWILYLPSALFIKIPTDFLLPRSCFTSRPLSMPAYRSFSL